MALQYKISLGLKYEKQSSMFSYTNKRILFMGMPCPGINNSPYRSLASVFEGLNEQ